MIIVRIFITKIKIELKKKIVKKINFQIMTKKMIIIINLRRNHNFKNLKILKINYIMTNKIVKVKAN